MLAVMHPCSNSSLPPSPLSLSPSPPLPYSLRLGDEGAQPILKALLKNTTLTTLNLSSNDIGEPSAPALSEVGDRQMHAGMKMTCSCSDTVCDMKSHSQTPAIGNGLGMGIRPSSGIPCEGHFSSQIQQ